MREPLCAVLACHQPSIAKYSTDKTIAFPPEPGSARRPPALLPYVLGARAPAARTPPQWLTATLSPTGAPLTSSRRDCSGRGSAAAMVQLASRLLKSYRGGHVVIRFALGGCTNRPFFRIVAAHSKRARDGKYLEQLGCLDPLPNAHGEKVAGLNLERLRHWLGCGAQLSRPAEKLLGLAGFLPLHPMTVTGAERLRRRRRAQEVAASPTGSSGGPTEAP
ncbi:28S ribosomal protein S16, mitochondrial isoform X2 [Apteryx rowi]|uniref:28S ribosomal protein S16, mitochondrial isoform X2 n=1 Tax=Apteryx rowi TaxID=308060 RepID=UPI000E1D9FB7|nr:28S ribosomal protein S16, mitochondrial isoform X2 [Apteryx rowi]